MTNVSLYSKENAFNYLSDADAQRNVSCRTAEKKILTNNKKNPRELSRMFQYLILLHTEKRFPVSCLVTHEDIQFLLNYTKFGSILYQIYQNFFCLTSLIIAIEGMFHSHFNVYFYVLCICIVFCVFASVQ